MTSFACTLGWWAKNLSPNEPLELGVDVHRYYTTNRKIMQYWNPNWRCFKDGFISRLVHLRVCSSKCMECIERIPKTLQAPIWSWQFYSASINQRSSHQRLIQCSPKKAKKKYQAWFTWKGYVHIVTMPLKLLINNACGHKVGDHFRNWIVSHGESTQI